MNTKSGVEPVSPGWGSEPGRCPVLLPGPPGHGAALHLSSPAPPRPLVLWGILGQVLFPLDFNQLVQLHGGLSVFHGGMPAFPNLDVPVQKLLGETLEGHGGVLWALGLPVEGRDVGGVAGEGLGVGVLKGFEVVVDGMPHHYLPCEDLQDLAPSDLEGCGVHHVLLPDATPSGPVVHDVAGGEDVLIIKHISVVADDATSSQGTDVPLGSCAHHLAVNRHHFPCCLLRRPGAFILQMRLGGVLWGVFLSRVLLGALLPGASWVAPSLWKSTLELPQQIYFSHDRPGLL